MELNAQLPFQKLIALVKALTPKQKAKLLKELSHNSHRIEKNDAFLDFLLKGPVYTENNVAVINENRKSIAAWRKKD